MPIEIYSKFSTVWLATEMGGKLLFETVLVQWQMLFFLMRELIYPVYYIQNRAFSVIQVSITVRYVNSSATSAMLAHKLKFILLPQLNSYTK